MEDQKEKSEQPVDQIDNLESVEEKIEDKIEEVEEDKEEAREEKIGNVQIESEDLREKEE